MNQKLSWLVGIMMMSTAINAQANIIVTPYIGYTGGGQVEDESGNTYALDPAVNYALSVETPLEKGRIGLFYSNQSTELEKLIQLGRYTLSALPKQHVLSCRRKLANLYRCRFGRFLCRCGLGRQKIRIFG